MNLTDITIITVVASLLISFGYMLALLRHSRNRRAGRIVRRAYFMDEVRPDVSKNRAVFLK